MSSKCLVNPDTTVADVLSKAPVGAKVHIEIRGRNTRTYNVECPLADGLVLRDQMEAIIIVPFTAIDSFRLDK